jgi:ribosomal-protein-alanine N-acetyltransferase
MNQPTLQTKTRQLRRMRDTDITEIMTIESVSFGTHHWSPDAFRNELKNNLGRYYVLLKENGELDGYCGYWLVMDEVHITTLAVRPSERGQSLGEVMVAKMLDAAIGHSARYVTLEVRVSNTVAQNLYYKYGFHAVGVRRRYYQDNQEDAIIMNTEDILTPAFRQRMKENLAELLGKVGTLPVGFA